MSDVSVRPVNGESDYQTFLRMPWTVYADIPEWVAPLWKDHYEYFQPEHNPELLHIDLEKFIAWRGETAVGTIIAYVNHAYNDFQEVNVGWFGQFELLEDEEAARALLDTASDWLRDKGVDAIMGPATFSTNSEIGLLVDGYEHPPMILTTHSRRYYKGFIEGYGFEKAMDMYCWYFDGNQWGGKKADKIPEKLARVTGKLQKRRNFTVRAVNLRKLDEELEHVKRIYNSAWEKNWGFIPMNDAELDNLAEGLKQMIDPHVALFAEVDGEPVAFGLGLPDIYDALRKTKSKPGEAEIFQLIRLLWHWKIGGLDRIRVWALGVLPEYRATGVDGLIYYELLRRGLPQGYTGIEMSWILENNGPMNTAIRNMGAEIYKTYRVYTKPL